MNRRDPITLIAVSIAATIVALSLLSWMTWRAFRSNDAQDVSHRKIIGLQGGILLLDEVLTMSVNMAAATGELIWVDRYLNGEKELSKMIADLYTLNPGTRYEECVRQTDEANNKLVALEHRSLDLIRAGQAAEARSILRSSEYAALKAEYSNGLARLTGILNQDAAASSVNAAKEMAIHFGAIAATLCILAIIWTMAVPVLKEWRSTVHEQQLREHRRLKSIRTLAMGVAHEVNNPLTIIRSGIESALNDIRDMKNIPADIRTSLYEALIDARLGSERVADIVSSLNSFTHAEVGVEQQMDLAAAATNVARSMGHELHLRARLTVDVPATVMILGVPETMTQVLTHLLRNAVDAIPSGEADRHEITIKVTSADATAILEVRDTGCGIPASARPHVCDHFFTTHEQGRGRGLGLSFCRDTIEALGGRIEIASIEKRGTIIRIHIPMAGITGRNPRALNVQPCPRNHSLCPYSTTVVKTFSAV